MVRRSLIAWKLSTVFITVLMVVILGSAVIYNIADSRRTVASARELYRLNSATIARGISGHLMTRDNPGIKEIFGRLAEDHPDHLDFRLISHDGTVTVSHHDAAGEKLPLESHSCQMCHRYDDPLIGPPASARDEIMELADGTRSVSVITPIFNEAGCSTSDCHVDARPVPGYLQVDFSLSRVDAQNSARKTQTAIAVFCALVLTITATWFLVNHLLARPMKVLITGMEQIGRGDFDFRMDVRRNDEFATVADSFNNMTSKLELLLHRLRETKEYMEGIVESSADVIVTVDRSGFIQTFNTGAEIVLGYSRDEVINERVEKLFADPQERDVAIARLKDSDKVANHETQFVTKSGELRDVVFSISRLRGPYGFPLGTFAIGKDVTNEKKLQRQIIQSERYAAIGQSFTAMQHSMKNMLNALPGGSYMVNKGIEKQNWEILADGWGIVTEGIEDIRELSKNLLMYVKDWKPEFKSVAIAAIITKIDGVFGQTASDNGAVFSVRLEPELPNILCDASLIHTAIMDIVSNALEACLNKEYEEGEAPRIDLTVAHQPESNKLAIEIRDNGPGMTEKIKANIFTPFFSTKKKKGTGLGLALTSRIVTLHGATIEVTSEPGEYSAFRILLPVAGPDENKEPPDGEESSDH